MNSQEWLRFHGQFDYIRRHYRSALTHLTLTKVVNAALNEWEFRRKKTVLRSKPLFVKIEPTPQCQLRCPSCWHGRLKTGEKRLFPSSQLSLEDFIKIIEPIQDTLLGVSLSWRGDAFINKETLGMLAYCRENSIATAIPSNLSYAFDDALLEAIVDSGLDHLIVALDGLDAETYQRYRRGGRFGLVLKNSKKLIEIRRKKRKRHPIIEWKFIVFQYNMHQIDGARNLSREIGFDRFSTVLDFGSEIKISERRELQQQTDKMSCYWPFRTAVVAADGAVVPCCDGPVDIYKPSATSLGNSIERGFDDTIWNGERYQMLRKQVTQRVIQDAQLSFCKGCSHF